MRRIDCAGIPLQQLEFAEYETGQKELGFDASAKHQIEARLAAHGIDQHMQAHVEAREALTLFETLLNLAQAKRQLLLREIALYRRRADEIPASSALD